MSYGIWEKAESLDLVYMEFVLEWESTGLADYVLGDIGGKK